jgi:hypothetical protein
MTGNCNALISAHLRGHHMRLVRFGGAMSLDGGGPTNMNMLCAIPNAIYMESGGKQKIVNGEVLAPESPGMSSEVSNDFITAHKVG